MTSLRVALLSTDTPHHLYWVWRLREVANIVAVFLEDPAGSPSFETRHPFEAVRDTFERDYLLQGAPERWDSLAPLIRTASMNSRSAVDRLRELSPDVTLVFGTGRLSAEVIASAGICLNLHGGHPEYYRGLDTHLWAVFHGEFHQLVTTLHHVEPTLDTGRIVSQAGLHIGAGMELYQLRAESTRTCVTLSVCALACLALGDLPSRQQLTRGRYYSAMPAVLKDRCVQKFARYAAQI